MGLKHWHQHHVSSCLIWFTKRKFDLQNKKFPLEVQLQMEQGQSCQKKKYLKFWGQFCLRAGAAQQVPGSWSKGDTDKREAEISLQEIPGTFAKGGSDTPKFPWQTQQQKQLWGCHPGLMLIKTNPAPPMKDLGGEEVEKIIFKAYLHSELNIPAILAWAGVF